MKEILESIFGINYSKLYQVNINGKNWYSAKSVCEILGLKNTSVAVRGGATRIGYFGIDERDICKIGGHKTSPLYISEYGVWKLILKSRKSCAAMIKTLLSERVLIEIMRTGIYLGA